MPPKKKKTRQTEIARQAFKDFRDNERGIALGKKEDIRKRMGKPPSERARKKLTTREERTRGLIPPRKKKK